MTSEVKFHSTYPLGMVQGNKYRVWYRNGKELTLKRGKDGSYVNFRHYNVWKNISIEKLHNEIFAQKKVDKSKTIFSKGELLKQNRSGIYLSRANVSQPIISMSGYILRGSDKGKRLSELSLERLTWYVNNVGKSLSGNELIELDTEVKKRLTNIVL